MPRAWAISASVRPPKYRSSMISTSRGSTAVRSSRASWTARISSALLLVRSSAIAAVSATCAAASELVFGAPRIVLLILALVWGVSVVADSAQLSALVAEYSPRDHVGTALTIQTCVGFLLTMASIRLVPLIAQTVGWRWAFLFLVPGPVLGAFALLKLDDARSR